MAKGKSTTVFFCQSCGYESVKWMGQCPGCRQWNTFVEESVLTKSKETGVKKTGGLKSRPSALSEISLEEEDRNTTRMQELDRVLGGGLVKGSLILVGGDPGIGKSTLLLQVCRNLAGDGREVLYVSGEESLKQIKIRANRIGEFNEHLKLLCETSLPAVEETIRNVKPDIVVIDSIQTMYH
ncbi:MAG: AAA family ATPase, partial [Lachnospiraceae bacterium]|nr:AAA family ATPase [Lachnospiraceae bacterium]